MLLPEAMPWSVARVLTEDQVSPRAVLSPETRQRSLDMLMLETKWMIRVHAVARNCGKA